MTHSAVGTQLAGFRTKPVHFLSGFGESLLLSDSDLDLAEEYLVHVYNGVCSKTNATTCNQLRFEAHIKSTVVALDQLPPTSSVIREHLKRAFFVIRNDVNSLHSARTALDPINYGWSIQDNYLLPNKSLHPLPERVIVLCRCNGKCTNTRCSCFKESQLCVIYCHKNMIMNQSNCINRYKC